MTRTRALGTVVLVAALVGLFEMFAIAEAGGHRVFRALAVLVMVGLLASFVTPRVHVEHALAFALAAIPLAALLRGGDWSTVFLRWSLGLLAGT